MILKLKHIDLRRTIKVASTIHIMLICPYFKIFSQIAQDWRALQSQPNRKKPKAICTHFFRCFFALYLLKILLLSENQIEKFFILYVQCIITLKISKIAKVARKQKI